MAAGEEGSSRKAPVLVVLWRRGVESGVSCLLGIGSVSHHVVSGPSSQVLNGTVAELFIPFLQQEGNSVQCGEARYGPCLAAVHNQPAMSPF